MFRVLAFTMLLVSSPLLADEDFSQGVAVEEAMRRANDHYIANFAVGNAAWNRGACHAGIFRAWQSLGVQGYHDYAVTWSTANNWFRGPEGAAHADAHCCGQTYIDLYRVNPQPVRLANIKETMDALLANPASVDDWWWIDAFFMAAPTFAKLGVLTEDPIYFGQLEAMYLHMKNNRGLFDPAHGLWYRDATAKNRTGANTPEFWGRGNGWVIAACARLLEELPAGDPRRPEFADMLQTMAAALIPLQGADGFWRSNLKFPDHYNNPETSCTAFFTYAIAYGINEGILDAETHTPVVMNAWNGMTGIALHPDGRLGYVQAIGAAPGGATHDAHQDYGYGAFLLAGAEILRLLGGPPPIFADAGPPQTIPDGDHDFVESATLDAGRSSIRSGGGITRYSWWLGTTFLGEGPQLVVDFPLGNHAVTLQATTTGGETLTSHTTVTVSPVVLVSAIGNQAGNPPSNTRDGSLATRWAQYGLGQWIHYELPAVTTLDHVEIAFYKGNERSSIFDLEISDDGILWTTVFSGQSSGGSLNFETFSFAPQPARFVRYMGNGTSIPGFLWNSLTEVSIPLSARSDTDADGLPDEWEIHHFGGTDRNPAGDPNGDGVTLGEDFILGNDPNAPGHHLLEITNGGNGLTQLTLHARAAFGPGYVGKTRRFRLLTSATLDKPGWQTVPGWESVIGDNLPRNLPVTENEERRFYQVASWLE